MCPACNIHVRSPTAARCLTHCCSLPHSLPPAAAAALYCRFLAPLPAGDMVGRAVSLLGPGAVAFEVAYAGFVIATRNASGPGEAPAQQPLHQQEQQALQPQVLQQQQQQLRSAGLQAQGGEATHAGNCAGLRTSAGTGDTSGCSAAPGSAARPSEGPESGVEGAGAGVDGAAGEGVGRTGAAGDAGVGAAAVALSKAGGILEVADEGRMVGSVSGPEAASHVNGSAGAAASSDDAPAVVASHAAPAPGATAAAVATQADAAVVRPSAQTAVAHTGSGAAWSDWVLQSAEECAGQGVMYMLL